MVMDQVKLQALRRLPKNFVSRVFGSICDVEFPAPMQRVVNSAFASYAGIDISEGERPPGEYCSLNAFFTRNLCEGARTIASQDDHVLVSPVDGCLGAFGAITGEVLLQAKGREYRLIDLVDSGEEAKRFLNGHYATIYLSPRDYHRIHSPSSGRIDKISYIPGYLFPVNPFAVDNIDELFAVNERLISYLETPAAGRVAVIKVGATCVGRIGLSFDKFVTNTKFRRRREFEPVEAVAVDHGDELGVFNLGSTVIVLISNPAFRFKDELEAGQVLRLGEIIGNVDVGS
ncbi:MAG: phosphatidylserine decarboxylase [Bradymonadaceae bacterium]|nr:phosphatidylserine decarboxylase [Lujinxingiaceae bacterium]